jgi:serine protease Do
MKYLKIIFFILCFLNTICGQASPVKEVTKQIPLLREEITFSYAPVIKKIAPAVVNIYTLQHMKAKLPASPLLDDPFFKQFYERAHPGSGHDQISLGSGVIINKEGFILTNYHVVDDADVIQVVLSDRREFIAKLIIADKGSDLALLKIDSKEDFPYLSVTHQEDLEVGDVVLAIGNPFGVGQTVTHGIVSALARSQEGISDFHSFIQTDAAINPGNSGGALVTTDGRLVGINTAIYSKSGGSMGIGFAIPTILAVSLIDSLKNGGHIVRPWLGLEVEAVTLKVASGLGLDRPHGVLVKNVYPDGPAYRAGIKVGDVISGLDGRAIEDKAALEYRVAISPIGKKATITVLRHGEEKKLPIDLIEPMGTKNAPPFIIEGSHPLQGTKMKVLSPAIALDMGLNPMMKGVVITEVSKSGNAAQLGVLPGDVLVSINKKNVTTKKDVTALLQDKKASWQIVLRRGKKLVTF